IEKTDHREILRVISRFRCAKVNCVFYRVVEQTHVYKVLQYNILIKINGGGVEPVCLISFIIFASIIFSPDKLYAEFDIHLECVK
ncbi:MAG: hypothetical protein K9M95_08870, partial [Candidatus Cloacimonetes bacterium]|nr:hypothetical protein [Candidatus Cloacimonadota bacterium]